MKASRILLSTLASLGILSVSAISAHAGTLLWAQTQAPAAPEPSSVILLGMGAAGLFAYAWRKRNRPQ